MTLGYKQTELGSIPIDWQVRRLADIARLDVGYAFRSAWFRKDDGIPLLRGENVGYGRLDWSDTKRLGDQPAQPFAEYTLRAGDAVIGMDRTFTKSGTKISLLREADCPCLLVQRVGRFVALKCDSRFLWAVISSASFKEALRAQQKGMDIPHLSRTEILSPFVAVPPTNAEQQAIAEVLSDADALIESLERLLAKKRDIKQCAIQELLTGRTRLNGFHEDWVVTPLSALADIRSGGTPSTTQPQFWDGDVMWCTPTDITALRGRKYLFGTSRKISRLGLKSSSAELIPRNSIVMTSRATIGECAINRVPLSTNQGFKNFVPFETVDAEFLYYLLLAQRPRLISLSAGSTFLEIGKTQLAVLDVRTPPTKFEQAAIAAVLSDMDAEIDALEAKLAKARQIKQGMMQELLTGRIRLV